MDKQFFENISKMIEQAISGYEVLLELYTEKKQALLKPDKDMLCFVDEKIMSHVKFLTDLNKEREKYCKENGIETFAKVQINNTWESLWKTKSKDMWSCRQNHVNRTYKCGIIKT